MSGTTGNPANFFPIVFPGANPNSPVTGAIPVPLAGDITGDATPQTTTASGSPSQSSTGTSPSAPTGSGTGTGTGSTTPTASCAGGIFNWSCWTAVASDFSFVAIGVLVIVIAIAAGLFGDGARKQLIAVTSNKK